jgi:amino acid transporter
MRPPRYIGRVTATSKVEDRALLRALGPLSLAAGIVNITVGGGIFRLPAAVAESLGAAAPLAYVVVAAAMALIVLCFAEAGSRVALTGGPYAYVEVAFGPLVGFLAGVLLWLVGTFALAAVATLVPDAVGALVPAMGSPVARGVLLGVVFAGLGWINVVGVKQGARLNVALTIAKLLPLVLVAVVGATAMRAEHLAWPGAPSGASLARTCVLLVFAFAGVESALVPSGEVRDPARTVPRAILVAMVCITVLYLALQLVAQGVLGPELAAQRTPLAEVAARVLGPWGRALLLGGAAVSMLGYVSGMILAVPRALYAFARDGFLPRALATVHAVHRTPYVAIIVQGVVALLLAVSGTFERLAILANVSTLVLYAACCAAAWELRRRDVRAGGVPFRVPLAGVVPALAILVIVALLTSVTAKEWAVVAGVELAGALLYFVTRARRAPQPA